MSSVGRRVLGWWSVLSVVGCATGVVPTTRVAPKAPAPVARTEPVAGEAPPLTAAPAGTPDVLLELDMAQLLEAVTAGTGVRLEPALIGQVWQVPGMDVGRPFTVAKGASASAPAVFAAGVAAGASLELAAPDQELKALGL